MGVQEWGVQEWGVQERNVWWPGPGVCECRVAGPPGLDQLLCVLDGGEESPGRTGEAGGGRRPRIGPGKEGLGRPRKPRRQGRAWGSRRSGLLLGLRRVSWRCLPAWCRRALGFVELDTPAAGCGNQTCRRIACRASSPGCSCRNNTCNKNIIFYSLLVNPAT